MYQDKCVLCGKSHWQEVIPLASDQRYCIECAKVACELIEKVKSDKSLQDSLDIITALKIWRSS